MVDSKQDGLLQPPLPTPMGAAARTGWRTGPACAYRRALRLPSRAAIKRARTNKPQVLCGRDCGLRRSGNRDANPDCALRAQRRNCSTVGMGVLRCGALLAPSSARASRSSSMKRFGPGRIGKPLRSMALMRSNSLAMLRVSARALKEITQRTQAGVRGLLRSWYCFVASMRSNKPS